jgi:type VII secretion-associated serine protease mycosin
LLRTALKGAAAGLVAMLTSVGLGLPGPAYAAPTVKPDAKQWYLTERWHVDRDVWPLSQGAGVTVAVIDTGVGGGQWTPPEMTGAFILPGTNLQEEGADSTYDMNGHGTAMAELIAARGTHDGFTGLAPEANILPIKQISNNDVTAGIRWAVDHDAKVLSISLASVAVNETCSPTQQEAVDYAVEHDVIVVASAGNDGNGENVTEAPGVCPGVTAVGAVDRSGKPWEKTQRKPYVAVAAPGVDMPVKDNYNEVRVASGTSNSTALVAATMALVRAKFPKLSAREVVQRVVATADDAGPKGQDDTTGLGVVNPARALTADIAKDAPNPVFARFDKMKADQRLAAQSEKRTSLLLKWGGVGGATFVLLTVVLFVVWSVRRRRRASRTAANGMPS